LNRLMDTIGARLAFATDFSEQTSAAAPAPPPGFREVFRTPLLRQGPFGPVPLIRVYEIDLPDLPGSRQGPLGLTD